MMCKIMIPRASSPYLSRTGLIPINCYAVEYYIELIFFFFLPILAYVGIMTMVMGAEMEQRYFTKRYKRLKVVYRQIF